MSKYAIKYRPRSWATFYGNDDVVATTQAQLKEKDCPQVWLITGPFGGGKTTLARIMAKEILGLEPKEKLLTHIDYNEENAGKDRSKEHMEGLMEGLRYKPQSSSKKVLMIDECHQLLGPAASVLLKPLEDINKHSFVIMATNEPEKLLKPLKDRATVVSLKALDVESLAKLVFRIGKAEDLKFCSKEFASTLATHFVGETRRCLDVLQSLGTKFRKEKNVDTISLDREMKAALDGDMINAGLFLQSLYGGKPDIACQLSQRFDNYQYLVRNLLDLNHFVLENQTLVPTYQTIPRRDLIKSFGKNPPSIQNVLRVQKLLFDLKTTQTNGTMIEPKQAMLVFAAQAVLSQK